MTRLPSILNRAAILLAILGIVSLSACSAETLTPMPESSATRFVLDLSGSNDSLDQYERLKPLIYKELQEKSLGNPFGGNTIGPAEISLTFILGSASQARVINLSSPTFGRTFYSDLKNVYGRSVLQIEKDWPLVLAAEKAAFEAHKISNRNSCITSSSKVMEANLGESTASEIAKQMCERANSIVSKIEIEIPQLISATKANGSDIFGALREVDNWIDSISNEISRKSIQVIFASDMVHWTKGQRDLFGNNGIIKNLISKEEICSIAEKQASASALRMQNIDVTIIGRGNTKNLTADEGEALSIFWECFADYSKFNLFTTTDGR